MCIRDRYIPSRSSDFPRLLCSEELHIRPIRVVVDIVSLVTVSYTHLRAHETVLDLVCRLLLEKKKKRQ